MSLLRMLAFRPQPLGATVAVPRAPALADAGRSGATASSLRAAESARAALAAPPAAVHARAQTTAPVQRPPATAPQPTPTPTQPSAVPPAAVPLPATANPHDSVLRVTDTEHWLELVARSGLKGPVRLLAEHAAFVAHADGVLRLSLPPGEDHLQSPGLVSQLGDALAPLLGGALEVRFDTTEARGDTARARSSRERDSRQAGAEQGFAEDPGIQRLVQVHGAHIVPDSIRPLGDA